MNELVFLKNDEAMADSLEVAEVFNKRHADVVRAIEIKLENDTTQNCVKSFFKTRYKDASGKWNTKYLMNKDGFAFLVMGFTGKKADVWKWKYIDAFKKMENVIQQKSTQAWVETRQYGQLTRKAECDTIKRLVEYAKSQGSEHSDKLYMTYSKLANKMSGITNRDESTVEQLNTLTLMENIILHVIDMGILAQKHYKDIYQDCKHRMEMVKDLAFIEAQHG